MMTLTHAFDARRRRDQLENFRREQIVVEHHIGLPENSERLEREQLRIARPRAHQIDGPAFAPAFAPVALRRGASARQACLFARKLVKPQAARLGIDLRGEQCAARVTQLLDPFRILRAELLFQLPSQALRERGAVAGGGNRNLQVARLTTAG